MAAKHINSTCTFCMAEEKHSNDLIVCSDCVQKLLALDRTQIDELHDQYVKDDNLSKAELLKTLL